MRFVSNLILKVGFLMIIMLLSDGGVFDSGGIIRIGGFVLILSLLDFYAWISPKLK